MNAAPLSAGYEFLRRAREGRKSSANSSPPRHRRIETRIWIWLAVIPSSALLLLSLGGLLMGDAGPFSAGFVVAAFVSPILVLWALIGGAGVERMAPRWASFHVGLSAGTSLVALFALRRFGFVAAWTSENVLDVLSGNRLGLFGLMAALLSTWMLLWIFALPAFTTLDAIRGVRAVRGRGLGKLAIELAAIGVALATVTWWIPWSFTPG